MLDRGVLRDVSLGRRRMATDNDSLRDSNLLVNGRGFGVTTRVHPDDDDMVIRIRGDAVALHAMGKIC